MTSKKKWPVLKEEGLPCQENRKKDDSEVKKVTEDILSVAVALGTTVLSMETTGQNKTSLESDVMRLLTYANLMGNIQSETEN